VQAELLRVWFVSTCQEYEGKILSFDVEAASTWGKLMVPSAQHSTNKQIAAIALVNNLILVTRNEKDFCIEGLRVLNPFSGV
jgi:predicted nucleic acid-binding protein